MDLHDEAQAEELLRQRVLCGWASAPEHIDGWRAAMDAKTKGFFWIQPASQPGLRAGHISLDSEASPPDPDLADPRGRTLLTVSTFFVLPEHRGGGLGRAAMAALEGLAREAPYGSASCRALALDTLSRRYSDEDEYRDRWVWLTGWPLRERGSSNEDWYARQGYVKFKEAPKYEGIREGHKLLAVYMKKTLV